MPTVSISRYEIEQKILPAFCIVTGEPTTHTRRQVMRWIPGWIPGVFIAAVGLRLFAGVAFAQVGMSPPCFIYFVLIPMMLVPTVALVKLKPIAWDVPIVYRKRHYWHIRMAGALIGGMTCLILMIGGFSNSNELNGLKGEPDYGMWASRIGFVGFVIVGIILHIVKRNSVHPVEITATHVTMANVHADFAAAFEIERTGELQREVERYAAYAVSQKRKDAAILAGLRSGPHRARRVPTGDNSSTIDDDRILPRSAQEELGADPPKSEEPPPGPT